MSITTAPSEVTITPDHVSTKFREVMGHFPTGVVVISATTNTGRAALTLQSFQALSLDPALILISVAKSSTSWPAIQELGSFAVTYLSEDQGMLARQFSRRDGDKFEGVLTEASPRLAHPILSEGTAWVECEIENVIEGGDHHIVIARIVDLGLLDRSEEPLIFFSSSFSNLPRSAA